jgi:hypothetical protein
MIPEVLDILCDAPHEVRLVGRVYRIGPLKLTEFGLLQRWLRDHAERPDERLKRDLEILPPEDHADARRRAAQAMRPENWPLPVGSLEGNRLLVTTEDGQRYFLRVMLGKHQAIADGVVEELMGRLSDIDFGMLVRVAFGSDDLDPSTARADAERELQAYRARRAQLAGADLSTTSNGPQSSESSS